MKGIYLAAYKAAHPNYNIVYQDINGKRDIGGDMMAVDLTNYDFVIASPPCNYWSRANYRRDQSNYSLSTKHLLPSIIDKLCKLNKPFIVENVRNSRLFKEYYLYDFPCMVYVIGRHTYWSNILIPIDVKQYQEHIKYIPSNKRQGGTNVHIVIELFLEIIHACDIA